MLFFQFECSPVPDTEAAVDTGGAYVNCWIAGRERDEAEQHARQAIEGQGWRVDALVEAYPITREEYAGGHSPQGLRYFDEAGTDGACFVFYAYPPDEPAEERPHEHG